MVALTKCVKGAPDSDFRPKEKEKEKEKEHGRGGKEGGGEGGGGGVLSAPMEPGPARKKIPKRRMIQVVIVADDGDGDEGEGEGDSDGPTDDAESGGKKKKRKRKPVTYVPLLSFCSCCDCEYCFDFPPSATCLGLLTVFLAVSVDNGPSIVPFTIHRVSE